MLQHKYRLSAGSRLKNPSTIRTPQFILKIAENNLAYNRFGFVVKKTIDKRAVERNRIKRAFRSCIEEMFGDVKEGYDMLFILEKGIIGKEREFMREDIQKSLSARKLLK